MRLVNELSGKELITGAVQAQVGLTPVAKATALLMVSLPPVSRAENLDNTPRPGQTDRLQGCAQN